MRIQEVFFRDLTTSVIDRSVNKSDRSDYAKTGRIGVSDVGMCHEYVRRVIVGEEPSQTPHTYDLAAFVGTAVGQHLEQEFIRLQPDAGWVAQDTVTVTIDVHGWRLRITGHPDLYNRKDLIDFKTRDGLSVVRRSGPTLQEQYQRVLYAKALIDAGEMDPDCWTHNIYIDRSGQETEPVVWSDQYNEDIVEEAVNWLADVIYAVENGEEAMRDKPREWCWAACPFAPRCRGEDDTDAEGFTDDPILVDAVRVYTESAALIRAAEKDKKSAASVLRDVSGRVGDHRVRWVNIGPTVIPEQHRAGYFRLDVRPVAQRRRPQRGSGSGVGDGDDGSGAVGAGASPDEADAGPPPEPGTEAPAGDGAEEREVPSGGRGIGDQ